MDIPRTSVGKPELHGLAVQVRFRVMGETLPPLPSYIASESPATEAAVIYAPGSSVNQPAVRLP